jgi:hypothetical protein
MRDAPWPQLAARLSIANAIQAHLLEELFTEAKPGWTDEMSDCFCLRDA